MPRQVFLEVPLSEPTEGVDFWWLNNGVTVVADQAQFMNNRLIIENPLIVNGLQTSYVLHKYSGNAPTEDERMILVRVIAEMDREKRDEIIYATNRQTGMRHSSFRANDPIQLEIEDYLLTLGFYYDRRKNFYKSEGKPANKIISIDRMAQAVLAVLKQEPHTARARPTSAIKVDNVYNSIFSTVRLKHPLELYGIVVRMLAYVDDYFRSIASSSNQVYRNNLKFHVLMVLGWAMNQNVTLPAKRIKQLDLSKLTDRRIKAVTDWVFSEFDSAGPEDKTAKDSAFSSKLKKEWDTSKTAPKKA